MKLILILISISLVGCASGPSKYELRQAETKRQVAQAVQAHDAIMAPFYAQLEAQREKGRRLDEKCAAQSKQPITINASEMNIVEEKVKYILKDPWSARFRNVSKASAHDQCRRDLVYVGEVNSKNSMGGYSGFSQFRVWRDGSVGVD